MTHSGGNLFQGRVAQQNILLGRFSRQMRRQLHSLKYARLRANPSTPPGFVLKTVKNAAKHVKEHAVGWRQALKKETVAIEIIKGKQADFFAFLISAISGATIDLAVPRMSFVAEDLA